MESHELTPEVAVSVLVSGARPTYHLERELALLRLSTWLNWPDDGHAFGNLALLLALEQVELGHMPEADLYSWIRRVLPIPLLVQQLREGSIDTPYMITEDLRDCSEDVAYIADVLRFLLSYKPNVRDQRKKASLGKAMFFLSEHGFAKRFSSSDAHLQAKWSKYRETAPFQFVRVYASSLKWTFDHSDATFLPTLTRAANDVLRLRLFFARSLWVQEQLQRTLDPRALKGADLFRFPEELAPSPCSVPPADASMYAHLDSYSRDRSGL